jgi:branched-chain amino acid transport system ATP-binding protein
MTGAMLQVQDVVKHFGALAATDHVDLDVQTGEIHALIGPNGAGKTTLINLINGELTPDAGRLYFNGQDITRLSVHRRSALGMARTYQITNIFNRFSVWDNVALAVQARSGHSFKFWKDVRRLPELRTPAMDILKRVALADQADRPASELSHGGRRQLGIAMVLATKPKLLLLDEPTAGMSRHESEEMVNLLNSLKGQHTILLVEHDMEVVFRLADTISVLVYGQLAASGRPAEIRQNHQVKEAYLGEDG